MTRHTAASASTIAAKGLEMQDKDFVIIGVAKKWVNTATKIPDADQIWIVARIDASPRDCNARPISFHRLSMLRPRRILVRVYIIQASKTMSHNQQVILEAALAEAGTRRFIRMIRIILRTLTSKIKRNKKIPKANKIKTIITKVTYSQINSIRSGSRIRRTMILGIISSITQCISSSRMHCRIRRKDRFLLLRRIFKNTKHTTEQPQTQVHSNVSFLNLIKTTLIGGTSI